MSYRLDPLTSFLLSSVAIWVLLQQPVVSAGATAGAVVLGFTLTRVGVLLTRVGAESAGAGSTVARFVLGYVDFLARCPHLARRCDELQVELDRLQRVCTLLRTQNAERRRTAELLAEVLDIHNQLGCGVARGRQERRAPSARALSRRGSVRSSRPTAPRPTTTRPTTTRSETARTTAKRSKTAVPTTTAGPTTPKPTAAGAAVAKK
jgi:hypothetical protein